jgi:2-phospho-L-lactate/phosphoenolpyruvate guanylyltransferase
MAAHTNLWALVAIKTRAECKCRLAGALAPEARLELVRTMLDRVVAALGKARTIDRIAVVSPERDTLPSDVLLLADAGGGLNAALDAARAALIDQGAKELVVLPADLPQVSAADIDTLVDRGRLSGFALATDAAGIGTNAIYLSCSMPYRFQFGPESCSRHVEEAARLGVNSEPVRTRGLELDLDTLEDLLYLRAQGDAQYASLPLNCAGGSWPPLTCCG